MTTIGTEEGRNYGRVNLKLVDRDKRSRSQKEVEKAIRQDRQGLTDEQAKYLASWDEGT